jgi:hypothetical protein
MAVSFLMLLLSIASYLFLVRPRYAPGPNVITAIDKAVAGPSSLRR